MWALPGLWNTGGLLSCIIGSTVKQVEACPPVATACQVISSVPLLQSCPRGYRGSKDLPRSQLATRSCILAGADKQAWWPVLHFR